MEKSGVLAMHSVLHSIGIQLLVRSRDTSYRKLFAAAARARARIPLDKVDRESIPAFSVIARPPMAVATTWANSLSAECGRATNWQ